jgi:hypothetical protein
MDGSSTHKLSLILEGVIQNLALASRQIDKKFTRPFTDGVGSDNVNAVYHTPFEGSYMQNLTDANELDFDVFDLGAVDIGAGAGRDAVGRQMQFSKIKTVGVFHLGSSGNLEVGGDGSAASWQAMFGSDTSKLILPPTGFIVGSCSGDNGWDVADTSNHILQIKAVGADIDWAVFLAGVAA